MILNDMTEKDQTIVNTLREHWGLPDRVTDQDIYENSKDSMIWARIDLGMAMKDLKAEIKGAMPTWAQRLF